MVSQINVRYTLSIMRQTEWLKAMRYLVATQWFMIQTQMTDLIKSFCSGVTLREHFHTHETFKEDQILKVFFSLLSLVLLNIICCGYLLESLPRGDSNRSPEHMILWINSHFLSFNTNPRIPSFVIYVRCKSGVTFVLRRFRDDVVVCSGLMISV